MLGQISGGSNPVMEDLSPERGEITFLPGQADVVFSVTIQDDKVMSFVSIGLHIYNTG